MSLPTKWAVEITSLQDAIRLQKIFLELAKNDKRNRGVKNAFQKFGHLFLCKGKHGFSYRPIDEFLHYDCVDTRNELAQHGYTILSITELENLLK